MLLEGKMDELFWQTEETLLKQFCADSMSRRFVPKEVIHYKRTAYVEEIANIRITLDRDISVSDDFTHFLDGNYMRYPVQEKGQYILEIKFDYIMPGYIRHMATTPNLVPSSYSKYCVGRKKLQSMTGNLSQGRGITLSAVNCSDRKDSVGMSAETEREE